MNGKFLVSVGFVALTLGIGACSSGSDKYDLSPGRVSVIKQALMQADRQASKEVNREKALGYYASVYKDYNDNAEVSLAYAKALRQSGYASKAITVLSPQFMKEKDSKEIAIEYIKDHLAAGLYPAAQNMAQNWIENDINAQTLAYEATIKDKKEEPKEETVTKGEEVAKQELEPMMVFHAPYGFYQLLGVSYDAQGDLNNAENNFRTALAQAKDKEDKAVIMNNLALNLLNQKKKDEAMKMISEAFVIAPDKPKIARNLELISDIYKQKK